MTTRFAFGTSTTSIRSLSSLVPLISHSALLLIQLLPFFRVAFSQARCVSSTLKKLACATTSHSLASQSERSVTRRLVTYLSPAARMALLLCITQGGSTCLPRFSTWSLRLSLSLSHSLSQSPADVRTCSTVTSILTALIWEAQLIQSQTTTAPPRMRSMDVRALIKALPKLKNSSLWNLSLPSWVSTVTIL